MAEDVLHISNLPQNLDFHIVTLFEKLETLRQENGCNRKSFLKLPMKAEIRTLEFWRSVICECIASFCCVFIVCGAAAGTGVGASAASILLATALAAGFAMTTLSQCFLHISGGHINPSVTVAMVVTKRITIIRAVMYVIAQSGGAVAGVAFLYGVTVPGYQGNLKAAVQHTASAAAWERFGVELILTFLIVLTYLMSIDSYNKYMGSTSLTIGASYAACSFVSMPYLNPARALGLSFVLSKWEGHWVYWIGPLLGGITSGLLYEYVFNKQRTSRPKDSADGDSSSINSDEDTYDDLDKPVGTKFTGSTYNSYRPAGSSNAGVSYCASLTSASLYAAPPTKLERVESLYGGTKSLYCKSPPLTRANLNRSQSVYTKSNSGSNKDTLPRSGPLVPAQSLYPIRLNQQQNHVQNQNVQNQLQQRSESIYGIRGNSQRPEGAYGTSNGNNGPFQGRSTNTTTATTDKYEDTQKPTRNNRPESMYGMSQSRRGQSAQSDDSSYSSYHGSVSRSNTANSTYNGPTSNFSSKGSNGGSSTYGVRSDIRKSPPTQLITATPHSASYHHNNLPQHSPSSQY
ncbi:neurogenic protein big brain [Agrilus planipennis]|uniref:Neurogenic protein big brain n=1 Tax=Agrilus planipennis TaxID=224129 RepID=A0A7F5RCL6_AGRPL|nr:neurogenic protein big brain [Agrilus planipennis]